MAGYATYSQPPLGEVKYPPASSTDGAGGIPRHPLESTSQPEYLSGSTVGEGYIQGQSSIGTMNQTQPYMDVHPSNLSSAQSYTPHGAPAASLPPQYHQYPQPPVLQPGATSYASSAASSYPSYGYSNGVTSPQSGPQPVTNSLVPQTPAQILPLPGM